MFQSFSVDSVATSSNVTASFDHGCEYPARIVGLWNASKEYQGQIKSGIVLLIQIRDNDNHLVYRALFMSLDGYVLGARATYARIMQGLLRCADTDAALQEKIIKNGFNNLISLVGRPCLARMIVKESNGRSWANIDTIVGETARMQGIPDDTLVDPVDIQRVCGKFIRIPSVSDCATVEGLKVTTPLKEAAEGIEDVIRDGADLNVF